MASRNFLAFDLGAESGRAMIGAFDGDKLHLTEAHRFPNTPARAGGHLRWNVLGLWQEMLAGLGKVASQTDSIASLGVDTWGVDFALLDTQGNLIEDPVHYRDARTNGLVEAAIEAVGRERIFNDTGIQFMQLNTLYQLYAMAREKSPALNSAHTLLMMPDLMHYWFTGVKACEFTDATTTQFFNPRTGDWARSLLADLGIPSHFLTDIIQPGTNIGALLPAITSAINSNALRNTQVIVPATHDTGSAVAGVPAKSQRVAYISSGTWSLMGALSKEPIITPQALQFNFTNEGGVNGTYRVLKNIAGMWLVQECRRKWAGAHGEMIPYSELLNMAGRMPVFAALIDPDHPSFLAPEHMPAMIKAYCEDTHQVPPGGIGSTVRCILESLALKYRYTLEQLEQLLGYQVEAIHIVGGGSQNALLCQFAANACNRPVIAGPVEATAIGNVLVQMVAMGELASMDDAGDVVRRSFPLTEYQPQDTVHWIEAYERFMRLLKYQTA
jgi:rhamnulokinase